MVLELKSAFVLAILLLGSSIGIISCERQTPLASHDAKAEPLSSTSYDVVLYQPMQGNPDRKVAEGRVRLEYRAAGSSDVAGTWQLSLIVGVNEPELSRLQGAGMLTGAVIDGDVFINLHPDVVDNNVEFRLGPKTGDMIRGTWQVVTDAGAEPSGPIELRESR